MVSGGRDRWIARLTGRTLYHGGDHPPVLGSQAQQRGPPGGPLASSETTADWVCDSRSIASAHFSCRCRSRARREASRAGNGQDENEDQSGAGGER